jgi:predicted peroxiredoxin
MDNLKKILFATIDYHTKGVDTYYNGGSMWLIFTDRKKWVIELTKDGTLWYNHYFFNDCFKYLSLDAVENQHYITKWVEDIIQNGLINTFGVDVDLNHLVEDTIQNGVKETDFHAGNLLYDVEDTIQNGVKHTEPGGYLGSIEMKGKIVHQLESPKQNEEVEDVIENGVKLTNSSLQIDGSCVVEDVIQNGIKETWGYSRQPQQRVNEIINGSIKETNWRKVDNHPTYLDNIINSNNCNSAFGNVLES